jgi:CRISPR/Cas system CSM-associated protein Csm3 (group 7 of RAMP superfamily)
VSAAASPFADPGGVRPVLARWVIAGELALDSPAHFGGERAGTSADMELLRDAKDGGLLLPGTSIAGAMRGHLADVLNGYYSSEDSRVAGLFGSALADRYGYQSPLILFDSFGIVPNDLTVEIRDGVQIDARSGTAEDRKKFDLEVLPAGTRFPVRCDLIISDAVVENELLNLLATSLSGLGSPAISLGARRSRGFGAVRTEGWRAWRFDLSSKEGWMRWLLSNPAQPIPSQAQSASDPLTVLVRTWPKFELASYLDKRQRLEIIADLMLISSLLVRSTPAGSDQPDVIHLRSAGRSVLSGTSLAGVLRSRALRIARVVREKHGDAEQWVEGIFGPRQQTGAASVSPRASRLRIAETAIRDGVRMRPLRIRIDRLTQGVVPAALFDEEPEYGGTARVHIELRQPKPGEAGLLFLVLKDLLSGDLAVGGTSSVGRGVLRGRGVAHLPDNPPIELDLDKPSQTDQLIDQKIHEFAAAPRLENPHATNSRRYNSVHR